MNIRQISYEWKNFAKNAYLIAVDIDKAELDKPTLSVDYPINGDIKKLFEKIMNSDFVADERHNDWIHWCKKINDKYPVCLEEYKEKKTPVNPYTFMEVLSKHLSASDTIVASNGTACVCSFQVIEMKKGQRMFTNAGASSMGYGLPAAIGAAFSDKNSKIICLEGDGSIQMNLQELQTVVHYNQNIKIFWLNNDGYHSIRQTQSSSFKGDERGYCGVNGESGISFPSAEKIANAYGIKYVMIDSLDTIDNNIISALEGDTPVICEVVLDKLQFFAPKLSSKVLPDGTITSPSLEDMYPFLDDKEMKENMIV
jgi:acetolactate synthase-1/2/3 large subunit